MMLPAKTCLLSSEWRYGTQLQILPAKMLILQIKPWALHGRFRCFFSREVVTLTPAGGDADPDCWLMSWWYPHINSPASDHHKSWDSTRSAQIIQHTKSIYIYYMCAPCRVWLSATKVIWPKYRWTYHTMEHRHSSMIHIIHIIHPDSTYPRRPPRPRLLVQKRLEPGDCRETLRQKRSGRHGIMDWWKILGDSSPGPNCVMPVSHGEKDGNHHSTVWKMKDAIMNVDDVKYMMIYLGMNIWMMYTPTLNISVYMSICYMYVSRVHNMRNPTSVKRWSMFRIFCRDQLSGYHGICRYTGCRTDW